MYALVSTDENGRTTATTRFSRKAALVVLLIATVVIVGVGTAQMFLSRQKRLVEGDKTTVSKERQTCKFSLSVGQSIVSECSATLLKVADSKLVVFPAHCVVLNTSWLINSPSSTYKFLNTVAMSSLNIRCGTSSKEMTLNTTATPLLKIHQNYSVGPLGNDPLTDVAVIEADCFPPEDTNGWLFYDTNVNDHIERPGVGVLCTMYSYGPTALPRAGMKAIMSDTPKESYKLVVNSSQPRCLFPSGICVDRKMPTLSRRGDCRAGDSGGSMYCKQQTPFVGPILPELLTGIIQRAGSGFNEGICLITPLFSPSIWEDFIRPISAQVLHVQRNASTRRCSLQ